jgi:hypothetical protein
MTGSPAPRQERIVVGYAHTPAGTAALRWAVLEAKRTGRAVEIVYVFDVRRRADAAMTTNVEGLRTEAWRRAQHRVHEALADLGALPPARFTALAGDIAEELAAAAVGAELLVLGQPGSRSDESLPARLSRVCAAPVTVVSEAGRSHDLESSASRQPGRS